MTLAVMLQGTASDVGKSVLVAGLCRIFHQDGLRTAPFKSQNMALNSGITPDGKEMGRAQIFQAEAAGIAPDVRMNPVLLKPTSDRQAQVVLMGQVATSMDAVSYHQYKPRLREQILAVYQSLAGEYEALVLEGAGSPAEINLRDRDIVNMGMAEMAQCPVILVADIDRGGVFAAIYGTLALLQPQERARVKGVIINKFRGDRTILEPGADMIEKLCQIPVAGIVPYIKADIEDEDSLSSRLSSRAEGALLDIAVIRFPRLSNFTDFNVFSCIDGVAVRYVERTSELAQPDLIILPGTKNTISDLLWMRQNGLEAAVLKASAAGISIFGICGGYQMMGRRLRDSRGLESGTENTEVRGMGLLETETEFEEEKMRTQVTGTFEKLPGIFSALSGKRISGYEIHMGRTRCLAGAKSLLKLSECQKREEEEQMEQMFEKPDGCFKENVCGTYVHGIFDAPGVAESLAEALLAKKGMSLSNRQNFDYSAYREEQFDLLAGELRKSLDMDLIYKILREGI